MTITITDYHFAKENISPILHWNTILFLGIFQLIEGAYKQALWEKSNEFR